MDISLVHVQQDKLQEAWKLVKPGLEKVRQHSTSYWIAEDVYAEIRAGRSTLHLAYIEGQYVGFVVLSPIQEYDGIVLHLWCAYCASGKAVERFLPELEGMARSIGAKRLRFWSPRAWKRRIEKHGFRINQTEYIKELT